MEIIDTQMHFGPGNVEHTLGGMDAIGVTRALVDEIWSAKSGVAPPGQELEGGGFRPTTPTIELASTLHPDRFSYILRIHRLDPEVESLIRMSKDAPNLRCLRMLVAVPGSPEIKAFADGEYDSVFAVAEETGTPMKLFLAGNAHLLARYAKKFPRLQFMIDHCGLATINFSKEKPFGVPDLVHFDEVLKMAQYPNVSLQWAHAPRLFGERYYPFAGISPYLRKAIDTYGVERVMWASDLGGNVTGETWAELLYYVLHSKEFSAHEKEWFFGKAAKIFLNWD